MEIGTVRERSIWLYVSMIALPLGSDYVSLVIMNKIASFIPIIHITGEQLLYTIFGILYFLCFKEIIHNLQKKKAMDVLFIGGLYIVAAFAAYAFSWNTLQMKNYNVPRIIWFYLPTYAMVRSITDYDAIADRMFPIGCVFFLFSVYVLGTRTTVVLQQGYETNMAIGFQLALCTLIFADTFLEREVPRLFKVISLVLTVVAAGMVLSIGSRGATVICLLYTCYQTWHKGKKLKPVFKVLIIMGVAVFCVFFQDIRTLLIAALDESIQQSRTLAWLFQTDAQLDSSGRFDIYLRALDAIKEKPLLGYGLFGDRIALRNTYVHNLFLEFCLDFGIPIGLTLGVTYLLRLFRGLKAKHTQRLTSIVGLFASGMLLTSTTYLERGAFWIALGIMMSMQGKYRFVFGQKR